MLIYNFGDWTEWLAPQKVTFIPDQKLIKIHPGESQIDVQIDLYSAWKEWIRYYDNAKWSAAFTTFGGDPTGENQYAPRYFFLTNGWKVYVENLSVVFQMNLYSDDGLSPFVINNAAVTNRASDVPIIKSEVEKRLDYGDRIYYDENSIYSGVVYPNGTIAQPVNNIPDAITLANLYNIKNFYVLSDVNIIDTGNIFENYTIIADRENLTLNSIDGNYFNNMEWNGFIINSYFGGGVNKFVDCIINNALDVSGQMKTCQINGVIRIWDNLVTSLCYSGIAGSGTPIWDMNQNNVTKLSIRSYSGGVTLLNCNQSGDTTTIELIAGQIKLEPSCINGYIDLRGVGYITDNSSGSTVITSGFISQTLTSEDVAKLTGITSSIDDMTIAVESLDEKVSYISGTTYEMNENVLIMTSGFTSIEQSISGMTIAVESLDDKVSYISGTTYEMNENVLIMTSGFTSIEDSISGMTDSVNIMSVQVSGLDSQVKRILGLSQENFRIMNHTYVNDNLSAATVKIYNDSSDCDNDINPLSTYSMIALYDAGGKLIDYKVTKT